ncbi:MAG: alpha-glucosidase/alpha-galactosidase [Spirochaetales bacterium]|nr:alpha-glucosidase/alpha-galactosidase [Spirochaetales bacterium]
MKFYDNRIDDITIAYIGGGSRDWAIQLMKDLACEEQLSGTIKLYDIDREAAYENEIIGNRITERNDSKGKWLYKAVETIEQALYGADFVIISILPGTFKEMAIDVHTPEKYGIYQPVGDTTGPGGMVRALRAIPMYVGFAEKIKECSPCAWVINYSNPMAVCTGTLYRIFPGIKALGCCHEVFGTQVLLQWMLKDMKKIEVTHRNEIKVNVLGINHCTWIDKASFRHIDLMPLFREFAGRYSKDGFRIPGEDRKLNEIFISSHRVKFDLFQRYGLIAAAGDRHLAEFFPRTWYLKDIDKVRQWKFLLTPVQTRVKIRKDLNEFRKKVISGKEIIEIKPTGEEGVRIMKALLGMEDLITNVNFPNQGQVKGLPYGAIVESNALFTGNNIQPLFAGELPPGINDLIAKHSLNHELILKAGLNRDKDIALQCLLNDPLVDIDKAAAEKLLTEMLEGTKAYLKGWDI